MFRFLIFFLIALLIIDISSLVLMVDYAGWKFSFYQMFGTTMLGLVLICYVLLRYGSLIRNNIEQNILGDIVMDKFNNIEQNNINDIVMDKFLLLLAGGLLILPGIFTDIVGLALLPGFVRRLVLMILTML
ncbi:MAG: FxsA family protein [Thermoguttaceae bacterium]